MKQISMILIGLSLLGSVGMAKNMKPVKGKVNPKFLDWKEAKDAAKAAAKDDKKKKLNLGHIPSMIPPIKHNPNLTSSASEPTTSKEEDGSPIVGSASSGDSKYDMRDPNDDGDQTDSILTPGKNQRYSGPCWAFAAYAAAEGTFKKNYGWGEDYSEDHLVHAHGFDLGPEDGGNADIAMAYLARGGPISEADDPYDTYDGYSYLANADTPCSMCSPKRYIDSSIKLPVRADYADLGYIKEALLAYGPLFTSIRMTDSSYDDETNSYRYKGSGIIDHGITIVGWDDGYTMTHDSSKVTGAFIIKDSGNFGVGGYMYVAYDDDNIAFETLGYYVDLPDSELLFDEIYHYDPFGMTSWFGYQNHDDHAANIFTASEDETLVGVNVAVALNSDINVKVYNTVAGSSFTNLVATKSVAGLVRGYHTVKLDSPVFLVSGQKFAVAVHYIDNHSAENEDLSIPLESPGGYASGAVASPGQSYFGHDGTNWEDITNYYTNTNIAIKALIRRGDCEGSKELEGGQWHMISMGCGLAPGKTVERLFSELNPAEYNNSWALYSRNAVNEEYILHIRDLEPDSTKGYWFFSESNVTLGVSGVKNNAVDLPLVSGAGGRMNLMGHPYMETVEWKNVEIIDAAKNVYSLAQASEANMISNKMYQWETGAYQVYDGETLGQEGNLSMLAGLWMKVYDSDLLLRIPVAPAPAAQEGEEEVLLASASPGEGKESVLLSTANEPYSSLVSSASSTEKKSKKKSYEAKDWYMRLIVESGSLRDRGNVLGQLSDSEDGLDKHDLKEKKPFTSPYLTVVFPHTDWEDSGWGYTTDFHAINNTKKGSWEFTVKASEDVSEATLRWEGPEDILKKAVIIDKETGKRIKLKKTKSYTFDIINGEHKFIFKTKKQPRRSRFFDK